MNSDFDSIYDSETSSLEQNQDSPNETEIDKLARHKTMRFNVTNEIIQTETNYVKNLKLIVEVRQFFKRKFFFRSFLITHF